MTGDLKWIVYPLLIRGIGVISSIIGTFTVPIWEKFPIKFLRAHDAEESMFRSYEVSSVITIFWSFVLAFCLCAMTGAWAALTAIGVGLAVAFNPLTSYFTATEEAAGAGDRQIDQHRPGHDHPLRPVGRHGIERVGAGRDRRSASSWRIAALRRRWRASTCCTPWR